MQPGVASLLVSQAEIRREISETVKHGGETNVSDAIIVEAFKDPNSPPEEKSLERLGDEGFTLIFAGTETTAATLSLMMFHLLENKWLLQRLRQEIDTLPPVRDDAYTCAQLEPLPFLVIALVYTSDFDNKGFI